MSKHREELLDGFGWRDKKPFINSSKDFIFKCFLDSPTSADLLYDLCFGRLVSGADCDCREWYFGNGMVGRIYSCDNGLCNIARQKIDYQVYSKGQGNDHHHYPRDSVKCKWLMLVRQDFLNCWSQWHSFSRVVWWFWYKPTCWNRQSNQLARAKWHR